MLIKQLMKALNCKQQSFSIVFMLKLQRTTPLPLSKYTVSTAICASLRIKRLTKLTSVATYSANNLTIAGDITCISVRKKLL